MEKKNLQSSGNSVWNLYNELATKKGITEIVINGPKVVFVERDGKFIQLNVSLSKEDINKFIEEIAIQNKKEFTSEKPLIDGLLPDGSRFNAVLEPFASQCPAITIRRYVKNIKSFEESSDIFGLSPFWISYLKSAVQAKLNIVVSGGTGVGKTTLLNLLLNEIGSDERLIVIEDTLELSVFHLNTVRLETGMRSLMSSTEITCRDLVKNSLRMRPDRIIVGEARGAEYFDLLQAMNTGHAGSMTSLHASSTRECLLRMETLYMMAGMDLPYHVARKQISTAVNLLIQIGRTAQAERVITEILEISGMEGDVIQGQVIARYQDGLLVSTGLPSVFMKKLQEDGNLKKDFFSGGLK